MKSNVRVEIVLIDMLHKIITISYRIGSDPMRRGPRHPLAISRMG